MSKIAVIWGVTGQDGSYLSELLLDRDYTVYGVARRVSVDNTWRVEHLKGHDSFELIEGDITDSGCVYRILDQYFPHEVYNLAAQSHVGTSFQQPQLTLDINTMGTLNNLEAIRHLADRKEIRFYQASSSEMFGNNIDSDGFQRETTVFNPRSPYAVSKVAAHQLVHTYRESYGIYACAGVLFNHECFKYDYPFIIKCNDKIYIESIHDIACRFASFNIIDNKVGTTVENLYVWDANGWTKVNYISWFKNDPSKKSLKLINARNAVYSVSNDHVCIKEDDEEIEAGLLNIGDKIKTIDYPKEISNEKISLEESELIGMLVGDGCVSSKQFINKDIQLRKRFDYLFKKVNEYGWTKYYSSVSGFTGKIVGRLNFGKCQEWLQKFEFYSGCVDVFGHRYKKIPWQILNSSKDVMEAFLVGYNVCDGLKANKCIYQFKNFKTNSPILASGLLYLISQVTGQKFNITIEESWKHGKQQFYYSINLLSDKLNSVDKYDIIQKLQSTEPQISQREIYRRTGFSRMFISKIFNGYCPVNTHHLEKTPNEIKKIIHISNYDNWFFDLETESGTLHAGLGVGLVHNSPRRGNDFVTQKIAKYIKYLVGCFENGGMFNNYAQSGMKFDFLELGNLDAYRDWGHARDYVEAMWLMMQRQTPKDYVIATGITHSIRDFLDAAFNTLDIGWDRYVKINPKYYRPAEVDKLRGDASLARRELDWKPIYTFEKLVEDMVV